MASPTRIPWVGFVCQWCWHKQVFLQPRDTGGVVLKQCEHCHQETVLVFKVGQQPEAYPNLDEASRPPPQLLDLLRAYIQPWTRTRWGELNTKS